MDKAVSKLDDTFDHILMTVKELHEDKISYIHAIVRISSDKSRLKSASEKRRKKLEALRDEDD